MTRNVMSARHSFYPYVMRYQITGYSQPTRDDWGNDVEPSPSFTSFDEVPVAIRFSMKAWSSGIYGLVFYE